LLRCGRVCALARAPYRPLAHDKAAAPQRKALSPNNSSKIIRTSPLEILTKIQLSILTNSQKKCTFVD
jgi:hypothetical protein